MKLAAKIAGAVVALLVVFELLNLAKQVSEIRTRVETINILVGDIHTYTYKMASDQEVARARH